MDNIKDMVNTDMAGDAFTGSWESGAGNGSLFVKDNSFDYDLGSVEAAISAFSAGTSSTSVSNPAVGDIYIVNLRGGSDYAVIYITEVDLSNNECSCGNTGKISFNYKKS